MWTAGEGAHLCMVASSLFWSIILSNWRIVSCSFSLFGGGMRAGRTITTRIYDSHTHTHTYMHTHRDTAKTWGDLFVFRLPEGTNAID